MISKRLMSLVIIITSFLAVLLTAVPASAGTSPRIRAFDWALAQRGSNYCWGGTGSCFDCSGLVMEAYLHAGISLPRTTYGMLGYRKLHWVSHANARPGDIVFFGPGHVELYVSWHTTFGALEPGTQVGYHHWSPSSWWQPTVYARAG